MKLLKITMLILAISMPCISEAKEYQMIFWYPGEAGSTAEAQPTIDLFFDYINKRVAPDKISGEYFNSAEEGLKAVKHAKFAIISFATFEIYGDKIGPAKPLLQTITLPEGKTTEQYTIVGKGEKPFWNTPLYSKQPLTEAFVHKYIIAENGVKPATVNNILPALKEISAGRKSGAVLLQSIEYFSYKNINQPWKKELSVWHTSKPVPTAPLIIIGEPPAFTDKLKKILLEMNQNPDGKNILESLRLAGFISPN
ncbi:MAG: hypothetical protein HYT75_05015 [Deltaproteobacteria bacterium]|nr:hypothetical protein [Deltaproteobacteria bacterium]